MVDTDIDIDIDIDVDMSGKSKRKHPTEETDLTTKRTTETDLTTKRTTLTQEERTVPQADLREHTTQMDDGDQSS